MRAITVMPGEPDSTRLSDVAEVPAGDGAVLVATLSIGICGTDREIVAGHYGQAPPGSDRLILGHESLGRVLECPPHSGLAQGDLVACIVRRPDPVPCEPCSAGEWDMCRNGRYTECGIKARHGFASERFRIDSRYAVPLDPALAGVGVLVEPTSVVAKAWEQIERIAARGVWTPRTVLVTGAGPIGLLAALLGVQRGLDVTVIDKVTSGPKPDLVADLGAQYTRGPIADVCRDADIIIEATGVGQLVIDAMRYTAADAIVCLTGVSSGGRTIEVDPGALGRQLVLENDVVFGSVNANRRHYEQAAEALAHADRSWLEGLLTRRLSLDRWSEAYRPEPDDVKVVVDFARP